ncbi:MAG: DUF4124 domain-containing protein [Gammaproteobacteria bacterium]
MRIGILIIALFAATASAEVYRSVDAAGNVIYSDEPSPGAELVDVQEVQTYTPEPVPPSTYSPPPGEPAPNYTRLEIISPANDESVRQNDGNVTVSVAVVPDLRGSDRLALYVDGQPMASGSSTVIAVENLDRGTHELRAVVTGPDGKPRGSSAPVTFHLLRHSAQHPVPANPAKPK